MRKKLLIADNALREIELQLPFSLVNPESAALLKRKFLRRPFNPTFGYDPIQQVDRIKEDIAAIKTGRSTLGKFLAREKTHLSAKADMLAALGNESFGTKAEKVYGKPSKKLISKAEAFAQLPISKKPPRIPTKDAKAILQNAFDLLGFHYTIKSVDMVAGAVLNNNLRQLKLKAKQKFSRQYAYRLAVHEIATHALRAENGRNQELSLFQRGTAHYLATEEGLAAYNEERAGVTSTNMLRQYAGRVLAVHYSRDSTFLEVYKKLKESFTKEEAFTLTLRAKRGTPGGDSHGACPKDLAYLKGYFEIKDYVAKGGSLRRVYAAKIALDDLSKLKRRHLKPAEHIPEPVIEWVRQTQIVIE